MYSTLVIRGHDQWQLVPRVMSLFGYVLDNSCAPVNTVLAIATVPVSDLRQGRSAEYLRSPIVILF